MQFSSAGTSEKGLAALSVGGLGGSGERPFGRRNAVEEVLPSDERTFSAPCESRAVTTRMVAPEGATFLSAGDVSTRLLLLGCTVMVYSTTDLSLIIALTKSNSER